MVRERVRLHRLQRAQLLAGPVGEEERECSVGVSKGRQTGAHPKSVFLRLHSVFVSAFSCIIVSFLLISSYPVDEAVSLWHW